MSYSFDIGAKVLEHPKWINACDHKEEEYIGTISFPIILENKDIYVCIYDIYIHENKTEECQHICLRYGDEDREYISAGPLYTFLRVCDKSESYRKVLNFLLLKGKFNFQKK